MMDEGGRSVSARKVALSSQVVKRDLKRISANLNVARHLQGKHLLITGSTGFFGKWLLALIDDLNHSGNEIQVTAVSRDPERFLAGYPEYRHCAWVKWRKGDVRSLPDLALARPVDLIIHAATDTLAGAHADPLAIFDTIVMGARNVLDLAVRSGASRVLFTGSGAQYGTLQANCPVVEADSHACNSASVASAYGEAKRAQETLAALYAQRHGVQVILTRCFAFAGPGISLDGHFAIGNFVRDAIGRDELVMQSAGLAVRSYLHGADLAGWLLTLLVSGHAGQAYNVGSDQALTIAELAHRVVARIAPEKPVRILAPAASPGAHSYYVPDIQKARGLGLDVWTSLDESIDSMADWILQRPVK